MVQTNLRSIQILRGVAAGLVVIAHVIEHADWVSGDPILITGRFGVDIFFVISGFIITYITGDGPFDPKVFAIRRIFRVVPLYWLCTLLVFFGAELAPSLFKTTTADFEHFLYSLFFIPHLADDAIVWRPLFKLGWTLNYEMFFYLLTASLFWCRTALQRATILTLIMGVLMAIGVKYDLAEVWTGFYANLNLLPFVFGVWLAILSKRPFFANLPGPVLAILGLLALILTVFLYRLEFDFLREFAGHIVMSLAALAIVAAGLAADRYMGFPGSRLARLIGDSSYSLYLLHMFVVGAVWAMVNRLPLGDAADIALAMLIAVPASLITAHISYRLCERPISDWAHAWTRRRSALRLAR